MKHALLVLVLCAGIARAQPPADFTDAFARLAELVNREELSAMDMARGSYDAARVAAVGAMGLTWVEPRFVNASNFGEAAVAGAYMTAWGTPAHINIIRRELEANPLKRRWLHELVGTEEQFFAHLSAGGTYQPLIRLMPNIGGARALALKLIESRDALVRRAGLFWGYWLADANYWKAVRALAKSERDRTTRRLAQEVLRRSQS